MTDRPALPSAHRVDAAQRLELLVRRVVGGDAAAWQTLWVAVEPTVWAITGKWQLTGPLARRDDERRDIVVKVMERLREDGFRRLKAYLASIDASSSGSLRTWLATVTARTAIDHVRAHAEYTDVRRTSPAARDAETTEVRSRWVPIVPMPDAEPASAAADPTEIMTAAHLLERARGELRSDQLEALYLWLQGHDHSEIADRLELAGSRDAERLVRAALKRLRDRYGAPAEPGAPAPGSPAQPLEETT